MICGVPALNKPQLAMMAMVTTITMTTEMIAKTEIEGNSAQRRQPGQCCDLGSIYCSCREKKMHE